MGFARVVVFSLVLVLFYGLCFNCRAVSGDGSSPQEFIKTKCNQNAASNSDLCIKDLSRYGGDIKNSEKRLALKAVGVSEKKAKSIFSDVKKFANDKKNHDRKTVGDFCTKKLGQSVQLLGQVKGKVKNVEEGKGGETDMKSVKGLLQDAIQAQKSCLQSLGGDSGGLEKKLTDAIDSIQNTLGLVNAFFQCQKKSHSPSLPKGKGDEDVPSKPKPKGKDDVPAKPKPKGNDHAPSVPIHTSNNDDVPAKPKPKGNDHAPSVPIHTSNNDDVSAKPKPKGNDHAPSVPIHTSNNDDVPSPSQGKTSSSTSTIDPRASPSDFIVSICHQLAGSDADLCIQDLKQYASAINKNSGLLALRSLAVSQDRAQSIVNSLNQVSQDPITKQICTTKFSDIVEKLGWSVDNCEAIQNGVSAESRIASVQGWLEDAVSDEKACHDGSSGMDSSVRDKIQEAIRGTSITLQLVKAFFQSKTANGEDTPVP